MSAPIADDIGFCPVGTFDTQVFTVFGVGISQVRVIAVALIVCFALVVWYRIKTRSSRYVSTNPPEGELVA